MAAAGRDVAAAERALARQGFNAVARLLRDEGPFYEWDHYPAGDVFDQRHGAQYFYHAHAADRRLPEEHGHFHCFLRPDGPDKLHHLVALAVDRESRPIRLFTVNRWVTEESWITARETIGLLDRFVLETSRPSRWVNRWLSGVLHLFRPDIERLILERDRTVAAWQARHPSADALAAQELEILSELAISVPAQIDAVTRAIRRRARAL